MRHSFSRECRRKRDTLITGVYQQIKMFQAMKKPPAQVVNELINLTFEAQDAGWNLADVEKLCKSISERILGYS